MSVFKIIEHNIPGQHIREHPHSIKGRQEAVLQLAIKQYIPVDQSDPIPDNAVTVIGAHGNGAPKELFEPLWEQLYVYLKKCSVPLRAIWIADVSNQGASGVLNEDIQGDTTNWYDHSRDLLHMVNHFRDEFPRPIIGVGHSMGCAQLVQLSIIHPRLLSTLILFEPVIFDTSFGDFNTAKFVARRQDLWESREKAEATLRKIQRTWDPRVVEKYLQFGLRPVPTRLYNQQSDPNLSSSAVTLTTTRHQESWSYTLPNLEPESAGLDRLLLPDWDPEQERPLSFSRPECLASMRNLPFVRPSVLWVFASRSYVSAPEAQDAKMRVTGTGVGGSGGAAKGMVEKVVLDSSHVVVFEQIDKCAEVATDWIRRWFQGWLADEKVLAEYKSKRSDADMIKASEACLQVTRMKMFSKRPTAKM
ncbi:toxin biosynthesis protein [Penicillium cinerascens]|uniref:Toxin biosynthesis protein n=1 Tax=Penicillium cinerascens TaxID=70096 RepID=A0A9W9N2K6_9EURO|nr:toxin biosynthesis protein [Penicillium cinerascens]KAJ5212047.1 toxin biosynthesis protein [Penicillium cinerascens]